MTVRPSRSWMFVVALLMSGCATIPRAPATAAMQAGAVVPGYPANIRFWSDDPADTWMAWRRQWLADRSLSGSQSLAMLAISSGSDKGAFAAGYLNGWTASGNRPEFALVTGVSTGALIAPFAFVGSAGDAALKDLYTGVDARDIFRRTPLKGALGGPSFADTRPLARLIERHVTAELVDKIASAHRNGRRLLVMTTNLDAGRGTVWDLGAIASSGAPDRLTLMREVLLASASIPGVFPPVRVNVRSGKNHFDELHVDGGTTSSVFVVPDALLAGANGIVAPDGQSSQVTLLYNGVLAPRYERVKPAAFSIIARALETVIGSGDRRAIASYRAFADGAHLGLCIETIPPADGNESSSLFDRKFMTQLFATGEDAGRHRRCRG